jgi:predicted nucleic acid-binding protein
MSFMSDDLFVEAKDLFIDTNVLVYAHDVDAGKKHDRAKSLVTEVWRSEPLPWISVQVLQELLVSLRRKEVPFAETRDTVEDYARWRVVQNTVQIVKIGLNEMERWQLSFWDALILAAARQAGATQVWSEDFSDAQDYGGIRVVNPFVA